MSRWEKRIILLFCLSGAMFAIIPLLCYGILNLGNTLLLSVSSYIAIYVLAIEKRKSLPSWLRKMVDIFLLFAIILSLVFLGLTTMMVDAAYFNEPSSSIEEKTVIVFGCRVEGDQPSLMLQYRLDTAYDYLVVNTQANCIVTGGLGKGKEYTESAVMKQYLIKKGIAPERIYEENQAKNTYENVEYSLRLMEEKDLSKELVMITSDFHQYRVGLNLNQHGMRYQGISGKLPWGLIPTYWTREYMAILRDIIVFS